MNLPDVSLVTHIKDPVSCHTWLWRAAEAPEQTSDTVSMQDLWDTWSIDLCQRLGFDEDKYATGDYSAVMVPIYHTL